MDDKEKVIEAFKNSEEPLNAKKVSELSGVEKKEVDKGKNEEDWGPTDFRKLLSEAPAHQGEHLLGHHHLLRLQGWQYRW